jgi:hypothetical protein
MEIEMVAGVSQSTALPARPAAIFDRLSSASGQIAQATPTASTANNNAGGGKNRPLQIYVFDGFTEPHVPVNASDSRPDAIHGEIVTDIIVRGLTGKRNFVMHKVGNYGSGALEKITNAEAKRQNVPVNRVDLSQLRFNCSFAASGTLSSVAHSDFVKLVKFAGQRGTQFYFGKGNTYQSLYTDVLKGAKGVHIVDGSGGLVGGRKESSRFPYYYNQRPGNNTGVEMANSCVLHTPISGGASGKTPVKYDITGRRVGSLSAVTAPTADLSRALDGKSFSAARKNVARITQLNGEILKVRAEAAIAYGKTLIGINAKPAASFSKDISKLEAARDRLIASTPFTAEEARSLQLISEEKFGRVRNLTYRGPPTYVGVTKDRAGKYVDDVIFYEVKGDVLRVRTTPTRSCGTSWAAPARMVEVETSGAKK